MKILAVDYGDSRTGLAISDKSELLATPITPQIQERSMGKVAAAVCAAAAAQGAERIVLGLPRNMDGSEGFQAQKVRQFMEKLQEAGLPVAFQDERLSTVSAHEALIAGGMRREERKGTVDKVAAAVILQQYLDKNR